MHEFIFLVKTVQKTATIFFGLIALVLWLSAPGFSADADTVWRRVTDRYGAIIRGDTTRAEIALVLTGDAYGDGGPVILQTLRRQRVPASFFLTGNFYRNPAFAEIIHALKKDGHYLGAHSDEHLLYCDWANRDSLLVTEHQFKSDIRANYNRMAAFGVKSSDAPWFLPPYEWYNAAIAAWTTQLELRLINFTPGTRSHADYTYPEMGNRYVTSRAIYDSILDHERRDPNGLNGFILLIHIGTDPRRTDKFYHRLDELLSVLKGRGYRFVHLSELLERYDLHATD